MPEPASLLDQRFLAAAVRIGAGALGTAWPNPAVGAVLVKSGRVVSAGRTGRGGRPHAEQRALQAAGGQANGATLYVSLEPCAHHGRTPPCTDALIAAKVARVVVGTDDPDMRVSGRGLAALEAAGISVAHAMQDMAREAHAGHITRTRTGRPWVTLKLAVSGDGMIGRKNAGQVAITGKRASAHVHALRSRFDGILVGRGTVEADDPQLTCRLPGLEDRSPVRIVLDTDGQLKRSAKVFAGTTDVPVLRLVGNHAAESAAADDAGHVETIPVAVSEGRLDLRDVLARLAEFGLTRILVEGGAEVAASFLADDLVDEAILFRSPIIIGSDGIPALGDVPLSSVEAGGRFNMVARRRFGEDRMVRYQRAK